MRDRGIYHKPSETESWKNSLPKVGEVLKTGNIAPDIDVAVEYNFELNDDRVDFIIYGTDSNDNESVMIIELKQWSIVNLSRTKRNYVFTYGGHGYDEYQHPSYQSLRYKKILEGFNEYVQEHTVTISACSYLHNMSRAYAPVLEDNDKYPYVHDTPVFYESEEERLANYIKKFIKKGKNSTLYEIDGARIRPSRELSEMLLDAIKGKEMFTLDDNQSNAVSTILSEVQWALDNNKRRTIIVKGGPGTGKSIVAINAMGLLTHPPDGSKSKNVCYCTSTHTPRTLYGEVLIDNNYKKIEIKGMFKSLASFAKLPEFTYDCIFMDEAHRMLPWKFGHGLKKDIDEIERSFHASRVNVWFIDEDQVVTKNDYLTIDRIRQYAKDKKSDIIETDDLRLTTQFRCMGGDRYIRFIRHFLGYKDKKIVVKPKNYEFGVCDSPSKLWEIIKEKQGKYPLSRLVAGYTHEWVSRDVINSPDPHLILIWMMENSGSIGTNTPIMHTSMIPNNRTSLVQYILSRG